ncbi:hypothetical protein HDV00_010139 [Rhizophlyctis rosea]|nr:hypothetical protein HDV00_010139 [Rhizophlyctis rosea]
MLPSLLLRTEKKSLEESVESLKYCLDLRDEIATVEDELLEVRDEHEGLKNHGLATRNLALMERELSLLNVLAKVVADLPE